MLNYRETAVIGTHFVSGIQDGDTTALSDREEKQLAKWLKAYPCASFIWGDSDTFSESDLLTYVFDQCDITGLWGECLQVEIWMPETKTTGGNNE